MQQPNIEPSKLKYFALVFAIATIGCMVGYGVSLGVYTAFLGYIVSPCLIIAYVLISQEQRVKMASHNIVYIVLYVLCALFAANSVLMIFTCVQWLLNGALFSMDGIFYLAGSASFTLATLASFFLCYGIRKEVAENGSAAPLIADNTV